MPWPATTSESTIEHYKEVVYRTGRSGGFKVAAAGLAWQAAGLATGGGHPNANGAFIAAASVYSRIWDESASVSNYENNDTLADAVYASVKSNKGVQQYTGKFEFQNAFTPFRLKGRKVNSSKAIKGTSTENGLVGQEKQALARAGVNRDQKFAGFFIGRSANGSDGIKDYRNRGTSARVFGYNYQYEDRTNSDPHVATIFKDDLIFAASFLMHHCKTYLKILLFGQ